MHRKLKVVLGVAGGLVVLGLTAVGALAGTFSLQMSKRYDVAPSALTIPTSSVALERGRHLALIGGCVECHGEGLGGKAVIDEAPIGRIHATNLTRGKGGVAEQYDAGKWARAIRNGLRADDRPLYFMPSSDYWYWGDEDVAALIAYLESVPPVDNVTPPSEVMIVGKILDVLDQLPINHAKRIDHDSRPPVPPAAATVEYGHLLTRSCIGCHGNGLAGGPIPGAPPSMPVPQNLTAHETGLGSWSEEQFFVSLREGVRPDGSKIDPFMPIAATKHMTDQELRAIWLYLRSLPPAPFGSR